MNGQQQQERGTAIARLERELKKVEDAALDAFRVEVDARIKAVEECRTLFARMIDDETTYRKNAILVASNALNSRLGMLEGYTSTFVHLSLWRRLLWVVFGAQSFGWFHTKAVREEALKEMAAAPTKAVYHGEKP